MPRADTLVKLAGTLGVPVEVLLDGLIWTPGTWAPGTLTVGHRADQPR